MKKDKYVFFYYWSHDQRPSPAKGVAGVGDHNAIKGARWEITEDAYNTVSLKELTGRLPWPFPEGNNDD